MPRYSLLSPAPFYAARPLPQVLPSQAGVFLSPLCIAQCLALVLNGAEPGGESARQLLSTVYGRRGGASAAAIEHLNSQLSSLLSSLVSSHKVALSLHKPTPAHVDMLTPHARLPAQRGAAQHLRASWRSDAPCTGCATRTHLQVAAAAAAAGMSGVPGAATSVAAGSSIWVAPRLSLQAAYQEVVSRHFGAQALPLTTAAVGS